MPPTNKSEINTKNNNITPNNEKKDDVFVIEYQMIFPILSYKKIDD